MLSVKPASKRFCANILNSQQISQKIALQFVFFNKFMILHFSIAGQ